MGAVSGMSERVWGEYERGVRGWGGEWQRRANGRVCLHLSSV